MHVIGRGKKTLLTRSPRQNLQMAGGVSRLRRIARRIGFSCISIYADICLKDPFFRASSCPESTAVINTDMLKQPPEEKDSNIPKSSCIQQSSRGICTICLEPLDSSPSPSSSAAASSHAIFTAQCMHSFHFACISSNVRHGSNSCPICRANWTQLPQNLIPHHYLTPPRATLSIDPTITGSVLESSIASSSHHLYQWSNSLDYLRYDDDEPIESIHRHSRPRLQLSLLPIIPSAPEIIMSDQQYHCCINPPAIAPQVGCSSTYLSPNRECGVCLSIKLSHQQPTDIVLIASPNGPHTRQLKRSMALVVFSLRSVDRLAIVICSSVAAARALPLRRMTPHGKQTALHAIDRVFYLGDGGADPTEGLKKGAKILEDRARRNPLCSLLHLSDGPTGAYLISQELEMPFPIHCFHVGFGFGGSNGFMMHEFDEFLMRILGGVIREAQLRIGKDGGVIRLGELRVGEERRIPLGPMANSGCLYVGYSYIESGVEEFLRTGELVVEIVGEKGEMGLSRQRRSDLCMHETSSAASLRRWDYMDPFEARRWTKHLHGCRV